jgi:hypothetical protein
MTHSENLDQLFSALSAFQSQVYTVPFDAKVKVKTKGGSSYSFDYATLGALIDATQKQLAENGLSVVQLMDGNGLTTIVGHSSGQYISGNFTLPFTDSMNAQERGGVVTYFRRYGYASALRLNSDKDDDANSAIGNDAKFEKAPWDAQPQKQEEPTPKRVSSKSPISKSEIKKSTGDEILDGINSFDNEKDLVIWFNGKAKESEDKSAFHDKYFPTVKDKIESLRS